MNDMNKLEILTKEKLKAVESKYHKSRYQTPKWIIFSLYMIDNGFEIKYYDAFTTVSKYIYVRNPKNGIEVKIRFSNHKPSLSKESIRDSDFYVGVSNNGVITTKDVIPKVLERLQ